MNPLPLLFILPLLFSHFNTNAQPSKVAIVNIDSISTYSDIGKWSNNFCNEITHLFEAKGQQMLDAFLNKYNLFLEENQYTCWAPRHLEAKSNELKSLEESLIAYGKKYNDIQHLLNSKLEEFTIQEALRQFHQIKDEQNLSILLNGYPILHSSMTGNRAIVHLSQDINDCINGSPKVQERWVRFSNELLDEINLEFELTSAK